MRKRVWIPGIVLALCVVAGALAIRPHTSKGPSAQADTKTAASTATTNSTSNKQSAATGATSSGSNDTSGTSSTASGKTTSIILTAHSTSLGTYLTDGSGRTLYTYDQDKPDVSNCSDACASSWPPYTTARLGSLPQHISDIKRADGSIQYTYNGMPLYYFAGEASGTITGNGVGGFHIVQP